MMYIFGSQNLLKYALQYKKEIFVNEVKLFFLAPVAWPIAKLLDLVLGKNETHTYKKAELKSFLQFHRTGQEPLRDDEISILNGVLELNTKNVETIMTPLKVRTVGHFISPRIDSFFDLTGYSNFKCRHHFGSQGGGRNVGVYVYFYSADLTRGYNSLLSGYSRFPVHEPGNPLAFIGLLLIKKVVRVILTFIL